MVRLLREFCLIMALVVAPLSASALTTVTTPSNLTFLTGPEPGDTYSLSDGLVFVSAGGLFVNEGQFQINIVNDFSTASTFSLAPSLSLFINPVFSLGDSIIASTGPFSAVLDAGQSLILTVGHDSALAGGLSFFMNGTEGVAIPLPATVWMMLSAFGLAGALQWRRSKKAPTALPA